MSGYEHLTREELISLLCQVTTTRTAGEQSPAAPGGLPVFGERERREFESSSSPIRIFDLETLKYLAVNEAAVKFYGYSRDEFLGMTVMDTRHPDEHDQFRATLARHDGYLRHRLPRRHVKKSGEIVVVELVSQDILFNGRKARLSLIIDITARLRMQELLWQRQQEFETLAENLPDLVARYDTGRRFVYVNAAIEKLFQKGRSEFIGRTQREVGAPEDLINLYDESLKLVFETACPHKIEFRVSTADGEKLFEALHVPERDVNGDVATVICVARDITERKHTEQEVEHQKQILDAIIENLPVGVFIRDVNTQTFLRRNRFAQERFGAKMDSYIGKTIYEVFPRELVEKFLGQDKELFQSGKMLEVPDQLVRGPDGVPRIQHVRKVPLYDEAGRPWLVVGISDDVTERKRAAQEVEHQKQILDAIIENLPVGVFIRDVNTQRYLKRNRFAQERFGPKIISYTGKTIYDIFLPEEAERFLASDKQLFESGQMLELPDQPVTSPTGETRIRHVRKVPLYNESGQPWLVVGIADDVTERKRVERELRETNEFLRSVIESSRDCIKVLDLDGRLLWINQTGRLLLEIDGVSALADRSYLDFWNSAEREKAEGVLASARAGTASSFEGSGPTIKGGPKWWDEIVAPILGADGRPEKLLVVSRDITKHKRAEEERVKHALRQRDALVREVHHRIKNSLQGIVGLLRQTIRRNPATAPEIEEAIAQLQSVALVYGLQETRPDGLLSLAEVTDAICSSAENLTGGRVERTFERAPRRPACVAGTEAVSVAVALNELVFNSLKHQRAEAGRKHARLILSETGDAARIRITNRGRLPRGFDFAEGRALGNGLGLVRTLLAPPGCSITFNGGRNRVEVVLQLRPPLLAGRRTTRAVSKSGGKSPAGRG